VRGSEWARPWRAVEYLLHVQETLVRHKERLRRVAEHAQRRAMDATTQVKDEHAKAKAARAQLRQARKALRTYEVLEQVRSGKPLDEILTGAILFPGDGQDAPVRLAKVGTDKYCTPRHPTHFESLFLEFNGIL